MNKYPLIIISGPTATGKTLLAAELAMQINAEIISADSRQVYKEMNLGTGKDYDDYVVNGRAIKYHLIDIAEPGYEYSVYEFQRDFKNTYTEISNRSKNTILCGGTGFYIEAAMGLKNYSKVEANDALREQLNNLPNEALIQQLKKIKPLHNTTDITDRERLIRALEIELLKNVVTDEVVLSPVKSVVFLIDLPREEIKNRIKTRLFKRLESGMVKEVEALIKKGISYSKLKYYGLEYKFIASYLLSEITYAEMQEKLAIAISQFAKRQNTWFKRMEKQGVTLHKINGFLPNTQKIEMIINELNKHA